MSAHQNIGTILRNALRDQYGGMGRQFGLSQDFNGVKWVHTGSQLSDLKVDQVKIITDQVKTSGKNISANELMKITFDMNHSFLIEKEAYTTSAMLELPTDIRKDIAGVPEKIAFPHVGEHTVSMKNECPLPSHLDSQPGATVTLKYEEKHYSATIRVLTSFRGTATFGGRYPVDVKEAIKKHSSTCKQCTSEGDFISIGTCKISTRKYLGVSL